MWSIECGAHWTQRENKVRDPETVNSLLYVSTVAILADNKSRPCDKNTEIPYLTTNKYSISYFDEFLYLTGKGEKGEALLQLS